MSSINPNNINTQYPVPGEDQDSQGFRDNFTAIANNFATAQAELNDLQAKVVLKQALNGTLLDNDMAGAVIKSATMTDMRLPVFLNTTSSNNTQNFVTLDSRNGAYQYVSLAANTQYQFQPVLSLINGTVTTVFLEISALPGARLQFQDNTSGLYYQGLDSLPGVGLNNNGKTLYLDNVLNETLGNTLVYSITMRSTANNSPTQGVVVVQDVTQLQSRVLYGVPTVNPMNGLYIGAPGDRRGDLLISKGNAQVGSRIWFCLDNFDVNNSNTANTAIWASVIGSEKDLSPQGPDFAVQYKNANTGSFEGNVGFLFQPSTDASNAYLAGNLTVGGVDGGFIDSTFYGNIYITGQSGNGGIINSATFLGNLNSSNTTNLAYANIITANGFQVQGGPNLSPTNTPGAGTGPWALVSGGNNTIQYANVVTRPSTLGGSGAVQYYDTATDNFKSNTGLTFQDTSGNLTVSGNVTAAWFYGNVIGNIAGNLIVPGPNRGVVYNDDGNAASLSTFTFDELTGQVTVTGNLSANNITLGANIQGNTATFSQLAATLTTAAQPNITSLGTLSNLTATGNITTSNYFLGNITLATGYFTYSNANVANYLLDNNIIIKSISQVGSITSNSVITGNIVSAGTVDISAGTVDLGNVANVTLTGGNNGQYLQTIGNGNIRWVDISGAGVPGGPEGAVQYSANSNFAGNSTFTFDQANSILTVGNLTVVGNITNSTFRRANGANQKIQLSDGNGNFTISGNLDFDGANLIVGNNLSATGNLSGANLSIADNAAVGGNISSGNLIVGNASSNITTTASNIFATSIANINDNGNTTNTVSNTTITTNSIVIQSIIDSNISNVPTTTSSNIVIGSGNISVSGYYLGNGALLTGIGGSSNYGNSNVANYLSSNSNIVISIGNGNIGTANGNITANYYLGNGAFLTGIAGEYSNSNVANYLPVYSGNLANLGGNVITTANVQASNLIGTLASNSSISNIKVNSTISFNINGNSNAVSIAANTYSNFINIQGNVANFNGNIVANNISTTGTGITTITSGGDIILQPAVGSQVTAMGNLQVTGNTRIATLTPANSSVSGTAGQIAWDANYLYICTSTDTWKRVSLSSF